MTTDILWPTIALVALIYAVWFVLYVRRTRHLRQNPPGPDTFRDGTSSLAYFRPVEMPAHNFANLFEMPVLFFALVPLLLITGLDGPVQVALAWAFVALRAVHSAIHVGRNVIMQRFYAYFASCVVLAAMWIGFAVDLLALDEAAMTTLG